MATTLWDLSLAGSYSVSRAGQPGEGKALEQLPVPAGGLMAFGPARAQASGYAVRILPNTDDLSIVIEAERELFIDLSSSTAQLGDRHIRLQQARHAALLQDRKAISTWPGDGIPHELRIPAGASLRLSLDIKPMLPAAWANERSNKDSAFPSLIAGLPFQLNLRSGAAKESEQLNIQGRFREAKPRVSYR